MADVGVAATGEIVAAVRRRAAARREPARAGEAGDAARPRRRRRRRRRQSDGKPHVMLVVGVNGVGKTTTIGKLANQLRAGGPRRR